jgi:hypothetical protein
MKQGFLSQYFDGVAIKRLSSVEVSALFSNQHEFNGVSGLVQILGEPIGKTRLNAKFLFFVEDEVEPISEDGFLTWYDAREKARTERDIMRWEYRLYFSSTKMPHCAGADDALFVAKRSDGSLLVIVTPHDTTIERQLLWLFGNVGAQETEFAVAQLAGGDSCKIDFAARMILEHIGIDVEDDSEIMLESLLHNFGTEFPSTTQFSEFARASLDDVSSRDNPDLALLTWMEREEILFKVFEKHLMAEKIQTLVATAKVEVEPILTMVQSALQRRKSRAGFALENHLQQIFRDFKISFTRTGVTERRLKPDFIFPSIEAYHNDKFPILRLTMLASKSTCKDRWRQILNEAAKIPIKHLLTLEPGISEHQTKEMATENVQLVLPKELHATFTSTQQREIMSVSDFIALVKKREATR